MATSSGIVHGNRSQEEVFGNPFYEVLRADFEHTLVRSLQTGGSLVVLPSELVLRQLTKPVFSSKKFAEAHILQAAHIPGLFCSARGQGVELRGDRLILTSAAHVATILQSETIFDFSESFRVVIVDKPLDPSFGVSMDTVSADPLKPSGGGPSEWLASCPMLENDFFERIVKLRKTFVLCPGFEAHLGARIRDMSAQCAGSLLRYLPSGLNASAQLVQADIERSAYASLHAFIFPHLMRCVDENPSLSKNLALPLERVLREMRAPVDLLAVHKSLESLLPLRVGADFTKLGQSITPQQKVNALTRIVDTLTCVLGEMGIRNFSSEHLLAAMTAALMVSGLAKAPAHMAHMDMFLVNHPELAMDKSSFAVATFSSSLEFLCKAVLPS